jgi:hypothetical protein
MSATQNSIANSRRGGSVRLNRMMALPTARMVNVWPTPQSKPMRAAPRTLRSRLTMVETATMWSASVACNMPRKNPSTTTGNDCTRAPRSLLNPDEQYARPTVIVEFPIIGTPGLRPARVASRACKETLMEQAL